MEYPKKIVELKPGLELTFEGRIDNENNFYFSAYNPSATINTVKHNISLHIQEREYDESVRFNIFWHLSNITRHDYLSGKKVTQNSLDTISDLVKAYVNELWSREEKEVFYKQTRLSYLHELIVENMNYTEEFVKELAELQEVCAKFKFEYSQIEAEVQLLANPSQKKDVFLEKVRF